jgi:CRP-like cAMP-binding protein
VLARFGLFMLAQSQQATVCQAMHSVERRTARWLEQCRMRLGSVDIPMTQEFLAQMLGVQRTTISLTEKTMVNAGLISIGRGAIRIEDGDRLASAACECLTRIEERYVEMLGTYR